MKRRALYAVWLAVAVAVGVAAVPSAAALGMHLVYRIRTRKAVR